MFPVQLMTVRRSRNGTVRSVFLTGENSDYCEKVLHEFRNSLGKTRSQIEDQLKLLELRSQNPKVLKGLALLMFRSSTLKSPSDLDPVAVRNSIFSISRNPAVSNEERSTVLDSVASEMHSTRDEVEMAIYGDQDANQVLAGIPGFDSERLAKKYNLEQVETVMLKSVWMEISVTANRNRFTRKIRSLGLLYSEREEDGGRVLRVGGPLSILEHSERYGSRFAGLVRFILHFSGWELNANVSLKTDGKKTEFLYHLDESVSEYIDVDERDEEKVPQGIGTDPRPLKAGSSLVFPDYSVEFQGGKTNVFITRPKYYEEDFLELRNIGREEDHVDLFCIVEKGEKCPHGATCFRDEIDWYSARDMLARKYALRQAPTGVKEESVQSHHGSFSGSGEITDKMISHLRELYPDTQAMIDYLDFMGVSPAEGIEKAGFKVRWKGLRMTVSDE